MSVHDFIDFLNNSPTPYHAVHTGSEYLKRNGFTELNLADSWTLKPGGKYFTVKAHTTIVAFALGTQYKPENGFVVVGAHTDSPCLIVRPCSKLTRENFKQVAVSTYGGGIWRTWFDRGLGLAGMATVRRAADKIEHVLVDASKEPILVIPNLAIHLETERLTPKIDLEEQLQPILCLTEPASPGGAEDAQPDHHAELVQFVAARCQCDPADLLDFDLRTVATEPAQLAGLRREFVLGGRLDNLFGVFTALAGLVHSLQHAQLSGQDNARVAVCFDHEEVGSGSAAGAKSATFEQRNHRPRFDGSVVVKINENQRYATTTTSYTVLSEIAKLAGVKLTKFVVKNTSPCGSTIGPFISANLGALTIDVGCSQLAMHSARECADAKAVESAVSLYAAAFNHYSEVYNQLDISES